MSNFRLIPRGYSKITYLNRYVKFLYFSFYYHNNNNNINNNLNEFNMLFN